MDKEQEQVLARVQVQDLIYLEVLLEVVLKAVVVDYFKNLLVKNNQKPYLAVQQVEQVQALEVLLAIFLAKSLREDLVHQLQHLLEVLYLANRQPGYKVLVAMHRQSQVAFSILRRLEATEQVVC